MNSTFSTALLASLFTLSFAAPALGATKVKCGTQSNPFTWRYCVSTVDDSTNPDVVYYLHGGEGDEHEWENAFPEIYKLWEKEHFAPPTVVAISFGPEWLLVDKNASPLSGLHDIFLRNVIPFIESQVLTRHGGARNLMGLSMGGFNAISLVFKNPDLFNSAAFFCPMLLNLSPDSTSEEISRFRSGSLKPKFDPTLLLASIRKVIPTAENWRKESPFVLAQSSLSRIRRPLLLTYGKDDGFLNGDREFFALAQRSGANLQLSIVDGGHCNGNLNEVARFFMKNSAQRR